MIGILGLRHGLCERELKTSSDASCPARFPVDFESIQSPSHHFDRLYRSPAFAPP